MYHDCKNPELTTKLVNEIKDEYCKKYGKTVFGSGQKEGSQIKHLGS